MGVRNTDCRHRHIANVLNRICIGDDIADRDIRRIGGRFLQPKIGSRSFHRHRGAIGLRRKCALSGSRR